MCHFNQFQREIKPFTRIGNGGRYSAPLYPSRYYFVNLIESFFYKWSFYKLS